MSVSEIEEPRAVDYRFDKYRYHEQVQALIQPILNRFDRVTSSYMLFNVSFIALSVLECVLFLLFFTTLVESSLLAFSFALIFLTAFSFFIIRVYLQGRKPEQFVDLRDQFVKACSNLINYQEGIPEHHLALANAATKFASILEDREYRTYRPPKVLRTLAPAMEKFSCWWHWIDVHRMRELMFQLAVEEHLKLVKCEPTNLEVHAALANVYVLFSGLYAKPSIDGDEEGRWVPPDRFSDEMRDRFRMTAQWASEEFKILNDYAPDDPWVHAQLAYSYHDLQMPEEEILEYETILRLRPEDRETLFKLGMLYFQQGHNAKGLQIYDELKRCHYKKAENLIKFYGAYNPIN